MFCRGSGRFCTILFYLLSLIYYLKSEGSDMSQDSIILTKSLKFAND